MIERELAREVGRAAMVIPGDRLRAGAGPFHRLADALGSEHERDELGIDLVADAEAAADVARVNPELAAIEPSDLR